MKARYWILAIVVVFTLLVAYNWTRPVHVDPYESHKFLATECIWQDQILTCTHDFGPEWAAQDKADAECWASVSSVEEGIAVCEGGLEDQGY